MYTVEPPIIGHSEEWTTSFTVYISAFEEVTTSEMDKVLIHFFEVSHCISFARIKSSILYIYIHRSEMVDVPGSIATVLELSKIPEQTYA